MNQIINNIEEFDIIYIGGGPAGYVGAIRASQLINPQTNQNFKVACVEGSFLGGTCLNVGCIPSKDLLTSSYMYEVLSHKFSDFGIEKEENNSSFKANFEKIHEIKNKNINDLRNGISFLFKANNVTHING